MHHSSPFHAWVDSPLGSILLEASESALTGLYFADQPDCPKVPEQVPAAAPVGKPSSGELGGRALRTYRVVMPGPGEGNAAAPGQASLALEEGGHGGPDSAHQAGPFMDSLVISQPTTGDLPDAIRRLFEQVSLELDEYWQRHRQAFSVTLAPQGTDFQKAIWAALANIPFGQVLSYGELARKAGYPAHHARAVGAAVGSNPISILIPCHRVLAGDHTLNGYGGGLARKRKLLQLEGLTVVRPR